MTPGMYKTRNMQHNREQPTESFKFRKVLTHENFIVSNVKVSQAPQFLITGCAKSNDPTSTVCQKKTTG